jgi:hypothetical protein
MEIAILMGYHVFLNLNVFNEMVVYSSIFGDSIRGWGLILDVVISSL